MIARVWRGVVKTDRADDYLRHLRRDTFVHLKTIPGFIKAEILSRDLDEGIEFITQTYWDSVDAIKKFAGDEADAAVVPEEAQEMMVEFDDKVKHLSVRSSH